MPVWNMRIFPVASIPFPKGIAIQSIKETTIDNCKKISEYIGGCINHNSRSGWGLTATGKARIKSRQKEYLEDLYIRDCILPILPLA